MGVSNIHAVRRNHGDVAMTEPTFTELDGESTVYRPENYSWSHSLPAKAKSKFAQDYDVKYEYCRAQTVEFLGDTYVIVGEIDD